MFVIPILITSSLITKGPGIAVLAFKDHLSKAAIDDFIVHFTVTISYSSAWDATLILFAEYQGVSMGFRMTFLHYTEMHSVGLSSDFGKNLYIVYLSTMK